ncbi:hypothetical protein O6072_12245 [Mycolicibacterium neoaurum]|uniref:hypothetical protein n=1 Tax=Mycolicibacterium neoaurum TaxID=1795 RepID=UPI00248D36B4|nr:hypothetical protein [Mycolicibacterium neoaurum]WBP96874.1 hypothetical protein O7W24_12250 [Mycolicibacterium neoaurum]WBS10559.1 hypothetical protein O6072_12245 [Mycolicibacterium neoaurum]
MTGTHVSPRGSRLHIARSRGALSGVLLIALGLWGALIPFVGPYFEFAYTPDTPWAWTTGRGWLQLLPGVVAVIGGLLLLVSRNRATAMLGGWLGVGAGAWFVVGRVLAAPLGLGTPGSPVAVTEAKSVALELSYFSGLGAVMVFVAAAAIGRVSVRSVRDVRLRDDERMDDTVTRDDVDHDDHTRAIPLHQTSAQTPTATGPIVATEPDHTTVPTRRRGLKDRLFGSSKKTPVAH